MRTATAIERTPRVFMALMLILATSSPGSAQVTPPLFRASRDIVSIDVVVRDRNGDLVRDLTAADFEVREDGRAQEVLTSSFQEVDGADPPAAETTLLARLGQPALPSGGPDAGTSDFGGRRLVLLLFDLSAMEPEEVERGVRAAQQYVDTRMSSADMVAIATLTWQLTVHTDFTGDREALRGILESLAPVDVRTGDAGTVEQTDPSADTASPSTAVVATDARLRALRLLADALTSVPQKKALLYFTGGLGNGAQDTQAELRAATTAASRANMAIYPVDTRGLQTVIPNGPARIGSRGGEGAFSGSDVNEQFSDLAVSQDMMASMATATGGRLFSGTNDVSDAFIRVQRDTAAYYLLGYSSSNEARDGRFRRLQVRVRRKDLRVEARAGYYAERDFEHMSRSDREAQLEEYLTAPEQPSTLAIDAERGTPRRSPEGVIVPFGIVADTIPGLADGKVQVDLLAIVQDEQGRSIARLRDTITLPQVTVGAAEGFTYSSRVVLPPGRFRLIVVARENVLGAIGRAQRPLLVPDSSGRFEIVPLAEVYSRTGSGATSSLARPTAIHAGVMDGVGTDATRRPAIVELAIFRLDLPVFRIDMRETQRTSSELGIVAEFEADIPAGTLTAGRYIYQLTAVDPATGRFSIVRSNLDVP